MEQETIISPNSTYYNLFVRYSEFKGLIYFIIFVFAYHFLIYIYRVATSNTGIHYVSNKRVEVPVVKYSNPFMFEADYDRATFKDGIKCTVKSNKACIIQAFWGVPQTCLFDLLYQRTNKLRRAISAFDPSMKFSVKCIDCHLPQIIPENVELTLEFKPHSNVENQLLQCNLQSHQNDLEPENMLRRDYYPFVLLMVLKTDNEDNESSVVAMANAVHISDRYFKRHSYIINQYNKLSSGQVGNVMPLYLSSSSSDTDDTVDGLCLICDQQCVSIVLLPCRHSCLCTECFIKCDRCPICRTPSYYYFKLPNESSN